MLKIHTLINKLIHLKTKYHFGDIRQTQLIEEITHSYFILKCLFDIRIYYTSNRSANSAIMLFNTDNYYMIITHEYLVLACNYIPVFFKSAKKEILRNNVQKQIAKQN